MYIDEGTGGPLGPVGNSLAEFTRQAMTGGFTVNPEGGEPLLRAITSLVEWIDGQRADLDLLAQERKLGTSPAAVALAPHTLTAATGDDGFAARLVQLRAVLVEMRLAILAAITRYEDSDDGAAVALRAAGTP